MRYRELFYKAQKLWNENKITLGEYKEMTKPLDREIEQEPTTKNDLGVDCVSRKAVINQIFYSTDNNGDVVLGSALRERIEKLPSITPTSRESVDCIDRQATLDAIIKRLGIKNETYLLEAERVIYQQILAMPSVTPQLSSGTRKNSQKLENVSPIIDWNNCHTPEQLESISTTKNDIGVDCISRAEAIKCLECDFDITGKENMKTVVNYINSAHDKIVNLPSVTPQEPQTFKWCTDCREYDQEKHCCHRWSKVIRDTVEEIEQEQEPILDRVKAEILDNAFSVVNPKNTYEYINVLDLDSIEKILDRHKAESEG